ncbi:hypothetical protein GCM10027265_34650 [Jatrophihabitans fulvus]
MGGLVADVRAVGLGTYARALLRSGLAWLIAGLFLLGNAITSVVYLAGDEPSFLVPCLVLMVLAGRLLLRAHTLGLSAARTEVAPRDLENGLSTRYHSGLVGRSRADGGMVGPCARIGVSRVRL